MDRLNNSRKLGSNTETSPPTESSTRLQESAKQYLPHVSNPSEVVRSFEPNSSYGEIYAYVDLPRSMISQRDFVECYLTAQSKISELAEQLLGAGSSVEDLRSILLDQLPRDLPPIVQALPDLDPNKWAVVQKEHETLTRREIVRLARHAELGDSQITIRAIYTALMALELAEQQAAMDKLVACPCAQRLYNTYRETMHEARERAQGDILRAGRHFIEIVESRFGYTPALNVVSDYDGNLSVYLDKHEHSGAPWKPGELTNQVINQVDCLAGLTWHHRLPLTECPGSDRDLIHSAARMYNIAAQHSTLLSDTPSFCRYVSELGGRHSILSANHREFVRTQMKRNDLHNYFHTINGVSWDFHYADNKPRLLMLQALSQEQLCLNLFTEDDNSGVAKHISSNEARATQIGVPWNISDIYFIASRPGDDIWESYRVSEALHQTGTPYIHDHYDSVTRSGKTASIEFLARSFAASLEG